LPRGGKEVNVMRSKLSRFLRYLEVEKGFSQGTIKAYWLDLEKGLFAFLHERGKFEAG
jgi:site-specific recombinase XerC